MIQNKLITHLYDIITMQYRTFRNHFLKYNIKKILQVNNITISYIKKHNYNNS